jgi:hypothetical protein
VTIAEIVKMTSFFPSFVNEEDNQKLMEDISKDELHLVLHTFLKNKSPGPDDLPIEFSLGFYETLEEDLMRVINESRLSWRMLAAFNSTFIALILKEDNLISFDQYGPISLCNCIYKIITKVIALRVKSFLSKAISYELWFSVR